MGYRYRQKQRAGKGGRILDKDEALVQKYQETKDDRLIASLYFRNKGLVVKHVKRFAKDDSMFDVLVNSGRIGIWKAASKYDKKFGARFMTYADFWVRAEIGREASRFKEWTSRHTSGVNVDFKNAPMIQDDSQLDKDESRLALRLLAKFPGVRGRILWDRLITGKRQRDIAREIGCSRQRVTVLEKHAVEQFREKHGHRFGSGSED